MNKNFIDVSKYQDAMDVKKVIADNAYEFIVLRANISSKKYGGHLGKDISFDKFYEASKHITQGFYHFSYGDEGEVESFLESIKGKVESDTVLIFDWEESTITKTFTKKFIEEVRKVYPKNEFWIYASLSYIQNLDLEAFSTETNTKLWVAKYDENDGNKHSDMTGVKNSIAHQYTSVGKINGYSGVVDKNVLFKDLNKPTENKPTENKPETKGYAKEYTENGSCTFLEDSYIHSAPEVDKPLRPNVLYYKGETLKHYDKVIYNDGYIWVRYTRASTNEKAYVPTGRYDTKTLKRTETWCTFK